MQISYNSSDYISVLHSIAQVFRAQASGNILRVPERLGKGFFCAYNLPHSLSVMVSDTTFKENISLYRLASSNYQYFILQFNEPLNYTGHIHDNNNQPHIYNLQKNTILLTSSLMESTFVIPRETRIRSVRVILSVDFLNTYLGNEMADKFLSNYFSMLVKKRTPEYIGTDYRVIIDQLIREKIEHPLRNKFIYNRTLLLIERLVTSFLDKLEKNPYTIKLKDDEISKLIKVEALLVKDYAGAPPTISSLSKVATMSPTKLKKDFKSMYGLPIYEYYQKNRMMRAKSLLMEGRYAVKEVGMMVGYSNLGHFAASFKKEFGILPSELINERNPQFEEKAAVLALDEIGQKPVFD